MPHFCDSNFPDEAYLATLVEAQKKRIEGYQTPVELLVMWSGAALNWIGDVFTDPQVRWTKEVLATDQIILTGTSPEWNDVIIKKSEKSPAKLRDLMRKDRSVAAMFADERWDETPILVRVDTETHYPVIDGMHRVIAAIRDGRETIVAWVARRDPGIPLRPSCEPHVVYDFLRAYQVGANKNRADLVTALRFLQGAYANVGRLLKERFGPEWLPNEEIQSIIREAGGEG